MYRYEELRNTVFTEKGQETFLKIRDNVHRLIELAGAFSMGKAISGVVGTNWEHMACVDRLVELAEIKEVTAPGTVRGQDRIFCKAFRTA